MFPLRQMDIKAGWSGMHIRPESHPVSLLKYYAYVALSILEISEFSCTRRARLDAGRELAYFYPVITPGAFIGFVDVGIDEAGTVRAGLNAVSATKTVFVIDENEPFGGFEGRPHGAHLNTGRVLAVIAHFRNKVRDLCFIADLRVDRFEPLRPAPG